MNARIGFLRLASFAAVAAAAFAPVTAHAQKNRGQLVQAVVKLNQAQLAFAKKLAEDSQFAAQFDQATGSGNYDAAASLAASATGLSKSSISLSQGAPGSDDNHEAASAAPTQSVYKLASFSRLKERKVWSVTMCFEVWPVRACMTW